MAQKGKTIQLQSPENYIRTRARNLEIFECLINPGWKESGITNVVVARKHTNGNITVAIYLVDLYCLGVKDTMYLFNVSEPEYRDKLMPFDTDKPFIEIEYKLAHNIIFAAVEFAGDFGFNPHKDFKSITQYLLEEDTDDIELIDIECGLHGKPAYFQGSDDSKATVTRIMHQLERAAGKGNYNYKLEVGNPDSDNGLFPYEEDIEDEEIDYQNSYDKAVIVFRKYESRLKSLNIQETESFFEAVNVLFGSLVDEDEFDRYYNEFSEDLDVVLVRDAIPDEMLGLPISDNRDLDSLKSKLSHIINLPDNKFKKGLKLVSDLKKDFGEIPVLSYLELHFEEDKSSKGFKQKLNHCEEQFPDYPLVETSSLTYNYLSNLDETPEVEIIPLHVLFPNRSFLHKFEMQQYLVYAVFIAVLGSDKTRLSAFHEALIDLEFPDDFMELIYGILIIEKIKAVSALIG